MPEADARPAVAESRWPVNGDGTTGKGAPEPGRVLQADVGLSF